MNRKIKTSAFCLLMVLNLFQFSVQGQTVTRVEPPFWWTGFNHTELQVMLYGNNIGDLDPMLHNSQVTISRVTRVENPNYLFIYLTIPIETQPGIITIDLSKGGESKVSLTYSLKERHPNSHNRVGFNNADVICLITPDRFANGDPNNDEVNGMPDPLNRIDKMGRHGGDIQGIVDHLEYLAGLGYTSIWINPVVENNQPRASYHGYAATDFYKVDARFGTNALYASMVAKAGSLGIKVIMDQIMNHCGSAHWWMADLPTSDWVHFPDHFTPTNHRRTTINDPYASQYDRTLFTDGWFVRTMPDMNQGNPLLGDYLIQNSIWWIEYAGLNGIRHDTHPYAGAKFMGEWSCRILEEYPYFSIVGEEWSVNPAIVAKWQQGSEPLNGQYSCMSSMFDFPLQSALMQALVEPEGWNTGWIKLYEMLSNDFLYPDPFRLVIFPDNHDMDRFYTSVHEDLSLFNLGMVFFTTIRGIPQFYYGTEILMTNSNPGDHGLIRTDFPGGWQGDHVNAFSGSGLSPDALQAQAIFRKLLNWRKESPVIHEGKLMHFSPTNGVYCYARYNEDATVFIALNKSETEISLAYEPYAEILTGFSSGRDVLTEEEYDLKMITVQPKSALILELKR